MVIGPGKDGTLALVILNDGEYLPQNLNDERVLVFRRGESTGRQLKIVKPIGELASDDLLRPVPKPVCDFVPDPDQPGNPIHEHEDGSWWFYDECWQMENGPFTTFEEALKALGEYCLFLEKGLTPGENGGKMGHDETPETNTDLVAGSDPD